MKNTKFLFGLAAVVAAMVLAGCQSTGSAGRTAEDTRRENQALQQETAKSVNENNVDTQPMRTVILDWANRTAGEQANPVWLMPLVRGKKSTVKTEFELPDDYVIFFGPSQRRNRDEARVDAGLELSVKIANSLKQTVMAGAGRTLTDGQMAIAEEAATNTKVTLTGQVPVTDFWQMVETQDPGTGSKSRSYIWWTVVAFRPATWDQIAAKYLFDVVGQIPDPQVKQNIAKLAQEVTDKEKHDQELSDAQFKQMLELQKMAAQGEQAQAMARINMQGATNQAIAQTAASAADSNAKARWAAYRSGDPVAAAVASTTSADTNWVDALAAIANAQ